MNQQVQKTIIATDTGNYTAKAWLTSYIIATGSLVVAENWWWWEKQSWR